MKMNPLSKAIILFAVLDVACVLLYGFLLIKAARVDAESSVIFSSLNKSSFGAEKERSLETAMRNTATDRQRLDSYFVTEDDVADFIGKIESVGDSAGVKLTMTSAAPTKEKTLAFGFKAEGGFQEVYQTLALVEVMPFFISVKNVNITKRQSDSDDGGGKTWNGSFEIELKSVVLK